MKKTLSIFTILAFAGLFVVQPSSAGRITNRQVKQDKRIFQGIKSGELTRGETRRLVNQQQRIQQNKRRAWSDESLTWKERTRLERQQDKSSTDIYRLKNNDRDRN